MNTRSFIFSAVLGLLSLLILSSCVSQHSQKIWHGAQVVDKAWWVEAGDGTTPLYRCGDAYYALGKTGSAKGCLKKTYIPFEPMETSYCPMPETVQSTYLRLNAEATLAVRNAMAKGEGGTIELASPFSCHAEEHLTHAPRGLVKLPLSLVVWNKGRLYAATPQLADSAHATSAKYWRYPLSVLTAVTVDAPLTIAGNAVIASVFLVTSPITVPIAICEALERSNQERR